MRGAPEFGVEWQESGVYREGFVGIIPQGAVVWNKSFALLGGRFCLRLGD